jgi:hypothetical protein
MQTSQSPKLPLVTMIEDSIPYKLCVLRAFSITISQLPIFSIFQICYYNAVSELLNAIALLNPKIGEGYKEGQNDCRFYPGVNSRSHHRTDKTAIEKRRKTLIGAQAGRGWYLAIPNVPAYSFISLYDYPQSQDLMIEFAIIVGHYDIQAFWSIQRFMASSMAILMFPFFIPNRVFTSFLNCLSNSSSIVRMSLAMISQSRPGT